MLYSYGTFFNPDKSIIDLPLPSNPTLIVDYHVPKPTPLDVALLIRDTSAKLIDYLSSS